MKVMLFPNGRKHIVIKPKDIAENWNGCSLHGRSQSVYLKCFIISFCLLRWHFLVLWLFVCVWKMVRCGQGELERERYSRRMWKSYSLVFRRQTEPDGFSAEFMSVGVFVKISTFFVPVCLDKNTSFACIGCSVGVTVYLTFLQFKMSKCIGSGSPDTIHTYTDDLQKWQRDENRVRPTSKAL